ncbi:MAG: DUF4160 domain-containing protein [Armatimonadia bacterium]
MSPTVLRIGNCRFFFFSREEERIHVHIVSPDGEAKFWLQPVIALATYTGFSDKELRRLHELVEKHEDDIIKAWQEHFKA